MDINNGHEAHKGSRSAPEGSRIERWCQRTKGSVAERRPVRGEGAEGAGVTGIDESDIRFGKAWTRWRAMSSC